MIWSFEDARNRLDELLDRVELHGLQHVMRGDTRFIVKLEPDKGQEENQLVRAFMDGPDWPKLASSASRERCETLTLSDGKC